MLRVRRRLVLVVAFAAALALATYAFTASNVVPGTKAGQGEGTISGYTVAGVAYTLAANPTNIDSVAFTLSAAATTVKAKLDQSSSTYTNCSVSGGTSVTCDFSPDVSVVSADELSVVAVG
jgi:Tfp pilus assembly protein PilV